MTPTEAELRSVVEHLRVRRQESGRSFDVGTLALLDREAELRRRLRDEEQERKGR